MKAQPQKSRSGTDKWRVRGKRGLNLPRSHWIFQACHIFFTYFFHIRYIICVITIHDNSLHMFISYRANIGFIASQLWVRVSWTDHLFITTGDRRAMSSLQVGTVLFPHRVGEYWAATGNARFQSHTESRNWILLIEFSHSKSIRSISLFWFLGSHHFEALLEFVHILLAHAEPSTEYSLLFISPSCSQEDGWQPGRLAQCLVQGLHVYMCVIHNTNL